MSSHEHWDRVFSRSDVEAVSWFQPLPATSLRLLSSAAEHPVPVVDVGGGTGTLVDELLDLGWSDVTVVDVSQQALAKVGERLAGRRQQPALVQADVTAWQSERTFQLWHDRAVFHFLVDEAARRSYARALRRALRPGGAAVVGTFAPDGPDSCSGLPTARYDAAGLAAELGPDLVLEHAEREEHVTPGGGVQPFTWVVLRRSGSLSA